MFYRATLAYDGTDFEGWQLQRGARAARTVQGVVEQALGRFARGEAVRVAAAGRTDAGVHALGQVISFELARRLEVATLLRALNALLPADVRALEVAETAASFHARRSATGKLYRYELDLGSVQLPARRRFAAHLVLLLDLERVAVAVALYLGRQDFAALASSGSDVRTTLRTLTRSHVWRAGDTLVYEVEADGFLRKMVRSLVGGLVAAGRGARSLDELRQALAAGRRALWPAPAEARGLTLVRVDYPPESAGVT